MTNSKKILVTGATGFIGACLVHNLINEGFLNISIFLRENSNIWRIKNIIDKLQINYVDLLDYEKLKKVVLRIKPEIIFHLATYGAYLSIQKDIKKIYETNLFGLINLLTVSAEAGFEYFVNTGSSSEYGEKNRSMTETDLLEPNSDYGVSKASATLYCQNFARQHNLPIVTLRLFSPYGYYEDQNRLIPYVILSCLLGKDLELSSPNSVRDFIFIEDVVEIYIKVTQKNSQNISGQIFNIGSGIQHSVGEVVNKVIELTDRNVKARWGKVISPRMETNRWVAKISKAKEILDWYPMYNLDEGIRETIKWFKENSTLYKI